MRRGVPSWRAGLSRFEGVHRAAAGSAGADQGVDLVDEQDRPPVARAAAGPARRGGRRGGGSRRSRRLGCRFRFLYGERRQRREDGFQAVFEVAAKARAGKQRA